jgi:hypothetical protein
MTKKDSVATSCSDLFGTKFIHRAAFFAALIVNAHRTNPPQVRTPDRFVLRRTDGRDI